MMIDFSDNELQVICKALSLGRWDIVDPIIHKIDKTVRLQANGQSNGTDDRNKGNEEPVNPA